jgi:cytochrome c oxidase subunit 4
MEHAAERKHPRYLLVWLWLFILTVVEVVSASEGVNRRILIPVLVTLAIWKAGLVATYFMHLKFEPRRFLFVVLAPLPLACILVLAIIQEWR